MSMSTKPRTIDEYIAGFPPDDQRVLQEVRATIRAEVPDAEETISYEIPTFKVNGKYLVYFARHRKHIGIYPVPLQHPELKEDVAEYASGKASVKLPLARPIPFDLIRRIVKVCVRENAARAGKPRKKKA